MYEEKVNPNILSLTDTALTLIVAFMVTLPALFWSGMNVNTKQSPEEAETVSVAAPAADALLVVSVTKKSV